MYNRSSSAKSGILSIETYGGSTAMPNVLKGSAWQCLPSFVCIQSATGISIESNNMKKKEIKNVSPFFKDSDLRKRPKGQEHAWYNVINIEGE